MRQDDWAALGIAACSEPFIERMKSLARIQSFQERAVDEEAFLAISTRVPDGDERIRVE